MDNRPIGVFDSGLGGLTAVRELEILLPGERIVYFGDTGRVPYGTRGAEVIRRYAAEDCDFLEKKPAPDMALYALEKLGVSKKEAVFIGDAETDILTAKNSEIPCISVTWGFRDRDELKKSGAEIFVDTADELVSAIEEL